MEYGKKRNGDLGGGVCVEWGLGGEFGVFFIPNDKSDVCCEKKINVECFRIRYENILKLGRESLSSY